MADHSNTCATAVLILNYNGAPFIDECLKSLMNVSSEPFEIYVIDNGSSDSSLALVRAEYPMVRVIEMGRNLGFAAAYDLVIRQLEFENFILLNVDTIVDRNWLQPLLRVADDNKHVGACGSKIIHISDRRTIDHAGGMLTLIGAGLDIGKWEIDDGRYRKSMEIGFACGCSLFIKKAAYLHVGGFDPEYFMYHEDVDLCWKLRMFGYSVMFVPESVVYHHVGMGTEQTIETPFKTFHCQKNRIANIIKNLEPRKFILAFIISTVYDVVRIAKLVQIHRADIVEAILMGYRAAFGRIFDLLRKRHILQSQRLRSDKEMNLFFFPVLSSAAEYRRIQNARNQRQCK